MICSVRRYSLLSTASILRSSSKAFRVLNNPFRCPFSLIGNGKGISSSSGQASDSYVDYMPLEGVERLHRYCLGGYHPITIGDQLHNRYTIIHKLGFGSYSTIWLARDQDSREYFAIKVLIANSKSPENKIIRRLQDTHLKSSAKTAIPPLLDEFTLNGPNGSHHCLVTTPQE